MISKAIIHKMILAKCLSYLIYDWFLNSCDFIKLFNQAWLQINVYVFQGKMNSKRHGYGLWFTLCKRILKRIETLFTRLMILFMIYLIQGTSASLEQGLGMPISEVWSQYLVSSAIS